MAQNPFSDPNYGADLTPDAAQPTNPFADPEYGKKPQRTLAQAAKDTGAQLAEGVNTTLGAIPSVVAPQSRAAGFFRDNAQYWRDQQSDVLKNRIAETDRRIEEAGKDGVLSQIGTAASEYWNDPAQAARLVATNLPSMAATLGTGAAASLAARGVAAARGLDAASKAALAAKYGTTTAAATNATLNAGGARGEAFEDLQKAALAQGMTPEQAEQAGVTGSILPGVVGGAAGAISGKIGLEKAILGQATTGAAMRKAAGAFGAELAGEQIEELAPKVATNYQVGQIDATRGLTDGLGRTMVETAIGSGPGAIVAGGAAGVRGGDTTANTPPAQDEFTTSPGAADPNAPSGPQATPPEAPDLTTSPGAGVARDGMDFTRDVDTSGLSLQDPAELARQRAATVDYQPGDTTPQWDTQPGAAAPRTGLDMPAPEFDTTGIGLDPIRQMVKQAADAGGALSAAAGVALDVAASNAQFIGATGRELQPRRTGPGVTNESNVIDVQGRVIEDPAIGTPRRLTDQQDGMAARALGGDIAAQPPANRGSVPALPAPTNLRDAIARIRAQKQEAANAQATAPQAAPASAPVPAAGTGAVEAAGMKPAGQRQLSADEQAAQDREEARAKEPSLPPVLSARLQEAHKAHGRDVKRSVVERSIANEKANNTGTPKAKRERADRIARLEADLALFDEAAAMPPKEAAGLTENKVGRKDSAQIAQPESVVGEVQRSAAPSAITPTTTQGTTDATQADQALQASPQSAQAGAAPAAGPAPTNTAAPAPAGASTVRALSDGAPTANTGAQAAPAAGAQAAPQAEDPSQRVARTGDAWTRMPTVERQALAQRADLKPIVRKNVHRAAWADLNRDVQRKLAEAMGGRVEAGGNQVAAPAHQAQAAIKNVAKEAPPSVNRFVVKDDITGARIEWQALNRAGDWEVQTTFDNMEAATASVASSGIDPAGVSIWDSAWNAKAKRFTPAKKREAAAGSTAAQAAAAVEAAGVDRRAQNAQRAAQNPTVAPTSQAQQAAPVAEQAAPKPEPAPVRLGRNNAPLNEGGKPFKTRKAAGDAKKLQPMMRVVTVPGGYALAEKTPAQLAAEERASRRLRNPNTSARGEPIPAHAFIAAAGGLNRAAAADIGVDGNPRIGNRTLFAGQGRGLSMEQATQMLIQDGYLSEGASINDALALIKTSLARPQYNADGIERIAEAEVQAQFEDYLAAQEEAATEGDADPFGMANEFTAEELDEVGYTDADPALQAEVAALIAQAEAIGIDTFAILEDIARTYANATQDQYNAAARDALAQAIARGNQDGGSTAAQAAPASESAADQGLDPTPALELESLAPAEAAAQQAAQEQAAKAETARQRAADAQAARDDERKRIAQASVRAADTFELGQDPLDSLTGQGSIFDDAPAQSAPTAASDDEGRERFTLSIEMFGDVPYRASKPVDAGSGKVVSSRVITAKTKLTAANAERLGLPKDKGTVYAWRVSVIRRANGETYAVIEAMATDNGRSPDGEVLAHFKEVENPEAMERIAPAIVKAAMADWQAAQSQQAPAATESVAPDVPVFDSYSSAMDWAQSRAKSLGLSLKSYSTTDEYKNSFYPQAQKLYAAHKAKWDEDTQEAAKAMQAAMAKDGIKPGDRVEWSQPGAFLSVHKMSGVVKLDKNGVPHVHMDDEVAIAKPGGKIGYTTKLRWQGYMQKAGVAAGGYQQNQQKTQYQQAPAATEPVAQPITRADIEDARQQDDTGNMVMFSRNGARGITPEQRAENFARWSDNAPLISSEQAEAYDFKTGQKIVVEAFHGSARPDRIGGVFDPKRATSGPMAYFTSSPELASSYAKGKEDTSLADEDQSYANWFKFKPPGARSAVSIDRAWHFLTPEVQARIRKLAPQIAMDDTGENIVIDPDNTDGLGNYGWELQQARGNPLAALVESWLTSGTLFNEETKFMDVLRMAGFPVAGVEMDFPNAAYPGVFKTYVSMKNPLVVGDMPADVRAALEQAAKADRTKAKPGADMWDKRSHTLRDWWAKLNDPDPQTAAYAWTSIPDKVTDVLKAYGYDGIVDWSGKGGGHQSPVYIPFGPTQVKSVFNRGTFDPTKKDISFGRGANAAIGTPAATIRAAITKAYGKLLGQLESKGLVTLTQTQEQAIEAAARARADKTGQSVEQARATLRASVKNSVADQTQTENFQRWFKDSKVVDAEGRPLVVYHGTRREFSIFEPMKPRAAYGNLVGIYFTDDINEAKEFAEDIDGATDERSRVVHAYLSIQSDADGIIRKRKDGTTEYIVFKPEKIKSAIDNNGDFDSSNPDIRRSADGSIQGFFDPQTGQSFLVADNLTAEAAPGVLMHEVGIHMAADGSMKALFNRAAMMLKMQKGNPFMKAVQARMDAAGETSGEEAAAYIAEAYENDRANAPASVQRWLSDLLAAVKAWMFKKGIMGADRLTVADIAAVARANARSMARSDGATGGQGFGPAFSRAPAGDQTQTEAFKRWFKGSKAVDASGKPLVVYHGTGADFSVFTRDRAGATSGAANAGMGFFFTDQPDVAGRYAQISGGAQSVMPVYLSLQNPIRLTAKNMMEADRLLQSQMKPEHDGAIIEVAMRDGGVQSVFMTKEASQVKSAIGNRGTFDPADPDIRFSRAGVSNTGGQAATGWDAPTPTGFDDVIYKLQDKNIDLKRVVEAITKATGQVADSINAYLKEELFHKRAAKRVADFGDRELKPLMNQMRLAGLSMEDVEEYLHARHAKEANAVIAQRNPGNAGLQDGGSGMTNAAADNYFAKLDPAQRRKLEAVAKSVDAIIDGTRKLYVSYGLEDQAVVDGWANMYQHYIPLMREDKDGGMGTGQGFSVKGRETKGRTGSTRKVVDILANIASQREKLIVRGEKNRVTQALVGLAQANPNSEFWEVRSQAPTERVFDPKTGVVVERPDPLFKSRDNVVVAKVKDASGNVTEQMVVFNEANPRAARMAAAIKNLDAGNLEGLLGVSAKITRYFAAINTQYNPVFGVVNLVRDVQGAMVNLAATPLAGQQGKIAKDTMSALLGIYGDIRKTRRGGQATSQWAQLWDQFQDDGGTTGYRELFTTSADRANNLKSILNPESWMENKWGKFFTANGALRVPMSMAQKGASEIFGLLSDYNEAMENGVRLAAYKAALDMKMSREQAASIAKNLTVNFNRKGQVGQQAGAVYAFFNAAMQGTARIGQTLFDMDGGDISTLRLSKTGKAVVYGGVMLGVMQALALAGAGFDEEDPPEFVRERSLIIPTGWTGIGPEKGYFSIPMPLGLHVIPGIGRHATEFALSGFDKPAKRALSVIGMFADAFNPIGNAGLSMQTLAPTALDPLVALTENKDWTGKPIARVSSNKALPGHTQWKDTATWFSKVVAEAINWVSGGNEYVAGAFSPTPDQIDYLIAQLGGGVAREAAKVQQTVSSTLSGEELPTYKVPLVGRFVGNAASQASQGSAFYANLNKLNELETEIKGLRKDGKFEEASQLIRQNPQAIMIPMANRAERDVQRLRREKRELIAKDASREQVRAKEEQITAVMTRLNEAAERRKALATQ